MAATYYRRAALQGNVTAQFNLALMFRDGKIQNGKSQKENYQEALKYFQLAADQGCASARAELSRLHKAVNDNSHEENSQKIMEYYNLGVKYTNGEMQNGKSQEENNQEAAEYFKSAAKLGHALSAYKFAELLLNRNYKHKKICMWYGLAARLFYEEKHDKNYQYVIDKLICIQRIGISDIKSSRFALALLLGSDVERICIEAIFQDDLFFTQVLYELTDNWRRICSAEVKLKLVDVFHPYNTNGVFQQLTPLRQGLLLAHQLVSMHEKNTVLDNLVYYSVLLSSFTTQMFTDLSIKEYTLFNEMLCCCLHHFILLPASLMVQYENALFLKQLMGVNGEYLWQNNKVLLVIVLIKVASAGRYTLSIEGIHSVISQDSKRLSLYALAMRELENNSSVSKLQRDSLSLDVELNEQKEGDSSPKITKEELERYLNVSLLPSNQEESLTFYRKSLPTLNDETLDLLVLTPLGVELQSLQGQVLKLSQRLDELKRKSALEKIVYSRNNEDLSKSNQALKLSLKVEKKNNFIFQIKEKLLAVNKTGYSRLNFIFFIVFTPIGGLIMWLAGIGIKKQASTVTELLGMCKNHYNTIDDFKRSIFNFLDKQRQHKSLSRNKVTQNCYDVIYNSVQQ